MKKEEYDRYADCYVRMLEEEDVEPSWDELREAFIAGWKNALLRTKIHEVYDLLDDLRKHSPDNDDDDWGDA